MKTRTTGDLVDAIASEIAWRRKELTDLRFLVVQSKDSKTRQAVLTRAAVALLYAHWEGFVKATADLYLEFVAMQRCQNGELIDSFLAVALRTKLLAAHKSKKIAGHTAVVEFFRTQMENRARLPYKDAIRTEANLSSAVLIEILGTLSLTVHDYESKFHLIDSQLLAKRNHIAHGNSIDIDSEEYLALHEEMLDLMNLLRNQIENAAISKAYLRPSLKPAVVPEPYNPVL